MIKINLLGDDTAIDTSGKRIVAGFAASVVALFVIFYVVRTNMSSEIERLASEIDQKKQELERLEKVTKEVKNLEQKEAEYNNKILVIANLKKSKLGPVRILDDLNMALPEHAWITQVREESGIMSVDGKAIDNQTIANFMKELEGSDYFKAIDLGETRQSDDRNVKIKSFTLNTAVSYSGGAHEPAAAVQDAAVKK